MAGRTFTKSEGFSSRDLLQYGRDHLRSAKVLFEKNPACFDSAAYLSHLGIELLLKAALLDAAGSFPDKHDLLALFSAIRRVNPAFDLSKANRKALVVVDEVSTIRYPRAKRGISIGGTFWNRVRTVASAIVEALPANLAREVAELDRYSKGGRVLMSRPKSDWERTQKALVTVRPAPREG
jgi:HEPN domain-containing protein